MEITLNGKSLEQLIVLTIGTIDRAEWQEHNLLIVDIPDDQGQLINAAFLYDDTIKTVVAVLFDPSHWDAAQAQAWLNEHQIIAEGAAQQDTADQAQLATNVLAHFSAAFGAGKAARPASYDYLRKLIELLRAEVGDSKYQQLVNTARAYAGGKNKGKNKGEEQEDEQDDETTEALDQLLEGAPSEESASEQEGQPAQQAQQSTQRPAPKSAQHSTNRKRRARSAAYAVSDTPNDVAPYLEEIDVEINGVMQRVRVVWKMISRVNLVYQPFTNEPALITQEVLQQLVESFQQVYPYVDIPIGHEWDAPDRNTGFVRKLEIRGGGKELWGALHFTEPLIEDKIIRGTIADVSVWIDFLVYDQRSGDKLWPAVLAHVCLTNKPLMLDLGAFSAAKPPALRIKGASAALYTARRSMRHTTKGGSTMPFEVGSNVNVTEAHDLAATGVAYPVAEVLEGETIYSLQDPVTQTLIKWFREGELVEAVIGAEEGDEEALLESLGLPEGVTASQLQSIIRRATGMSVGELRQQRNDLNTLRSTNRKGRINQIKLALQGKQPTEGVALQNGYCLPPAVVDQVVKELTDTPAALRMSVSIDGGTPFDDAILRIVNKMPREALLKTSSGFNARPIQEDNGSALGSEQNGERKRMTKEELRAADAELRGQKPIEASS